MATFSKKMMGKEVGDAATYAAPHNMKGKAEPIKSNPGKGPNQSNLNELDMSVVLSAAFGSQPRPFGSG